MDMYCNLCKKPIPEGTGYSFRALQVRTLPVRDLDREKKVQALGGFVEHSVCSECSAKELTEEMSWHSEESKKIGRFSIVLGAGILLLIIAFTVLGADRVFVLLGLAAIVCGLTGMCVYYSEQKKKQEYLTHMKKEDALEEAAWSALQRVLPKKDGDNDLTYIPVTKSTLARKNGDLMILYDLLPAIAVEAYKQIHMAKGS